MSDCRLCGRYEEPDRETGYDADDLCPDCAEGIVCLWCSTRFRDDDSAPYCSSACEAAAQRDSEEDEATA